MTWGLMNVIKYKKHLNGARKKFMCVRGGPLYNKRVEEKLNLTDDYIKKVHENSNLSYTFECLTLTNRQAFFECLNKDSLCCDEKEFQQLVQANNGTRLDTISLALPTMRFWQLYDEIESMNIGQVTHPLETETGVIILHLVDEKRKGRKLDEKTAKERLKRIKAKYYFYIWNQEYMDKANIVMDEQVIQQILDNVSQFENRYIDSVSVMNLLGKKIMSYYLQDSVNTKSVRDFVCYHNKMIFLTDLEKGSQIKEILEKMVFEEYADLESKQLGLYHEPRFLLDMRNYANRCILTEYKKKYIDEAIKVDDREIQDYYLKNRQTFTDKVSVNMSLFYYTEYNTAVKDLQQYQQFGQLSQDNKSFFGNAIKRVSHRDILYNSNEYEENLLNMFFTLPCEKISEPVELKKPKRWLLAIKNGEQGERIKELEDVGETIRIKIFNSKKEEKTKQLVEDGKKKYSIQNKLI